MLLVTKRFNEVLRIVDGVEVVVVRLQGKNRVLIGVEAPGILAVRGNQSSGATSETGRDEFREPSFQTGNLHMAKSTQRFLLGALEYDDWLRHRLRRLVRTNDQLDDVLQETYLRLLLAGHRDGLVVNSIKVFALATARNAAIDWFRQGHLPTHSGGLGGGDLLDDDQAGVESEVNAQQEIGLLASAIESVSAQSRKVFILRKIYGFSQREIGARFGISENTVERHVGKAASAAVSYLLHRPSARDFSLWRVIKRSHGVSRCCSTHVRSGAVFKKQ